jgi:hypothetical protein
MFRFKQNLKQNRIVRETQVSNMATLYLKCKICKNEFASGFDFDPKSFNSSTLSNNEHQCPKGHVAKYDKKDYYFK